jgi:hypothetical protein
MLCLIGCRIAAGLFLSKSIASAITFEGHSARSNSWNGTFMFAAGCSRQNIGQMVVNWSI